MGLPAHLAKKIEEAKTSGGGNNLTAGEYVLVVKRILCSEGYKGTFLIPEFDVVESGPVVDGVTPNKPGSDVSCAWQLDGSGPAGDAAKGNAKQFFGALLNLEGADGATIMGEAAKYAGPSGDPDTLRARGMIIYARTQRKTIEKGKNAGKEADFPRFKPVEQTADEIAARRADLDARRR